ITRAPRARIRSTLTLGAPWGTTTVHANPWACAAQARARPWLPAECVTTPARRCSVSSIATALLAPRSLNAPVGCKVSGLSRNGGFSTGPAVRGVRTTSPSIRAAAARTASAVTRLIRDVCPPLTPAHGIIVSHAYRVDPRRPARPSLLQTHDGPDPPPADRLDLHHLRRGRGQPGPALVLHHLLRRPPDRAVHVGGTQGFPGQRGSHRGVRGESGPRVTPGPGQCQRYPVSTGDR